VLLVHGAATTAAVWDRFVPVLTARSGREVEVLAPDRPSTGDLAAESAALAASAEGAVVVGVSGGATLGLALLASEVRLAGAVLHEPAVGSLVPGLLDHVAAGYAAGGVTGFGRALYGPGWSPAMAPVDAGAVGRDLAMFRLFEPAPVAPGQGPAVVTVGALSPPPRHAAARALQDALGLSVRVLPGSDHFVHRVNPDALAAVVVDLLPTVR
jgi:pimeloyl-ACP methyl ester carboxylesterase